MIRNIVFTYGLGIGWLWWVFVAGGRTRLWLGIVLLVLTLGLFLGVSLRSARLRSDHEWIGGRLITHVGHGESRWDRRSDHDDGDDFEAHVGGGW